MRYASYQPGRDTPDARRPAHWSDQLKPGAPWVELNFHISIDPDLWARERGIPPERVVEEFAKLVDQIKEEAIGRGIATLAAVTPEMQGPAAVINALGDH